MKKILLSLFAISTLFTAKVKADEGMWIPMLIGKNYDDMRRLGLKLTAEDLYNANRSSLKDAIVHFGGGCTGEIISAQGLLITNHHCGYGNIASLSTVENNYLENGFWAKSFREELPATGLSVKFLVSMVDVTEQIEKAAKKAKGSKLKEAIDKEIDALQKEAAQNGRYEARVASYFNGNQYILLTYEVFTDVRLVATPPKSLGKFGGDTDNWMWPRHTADFAVFRVYANANNEPAAYSQNNVPYKPKHHLPVSLKGVQEGDYSMIMGYPGRTNRYETSYGVDMAINDVNPAIVKLRDARLSIMRKYMRQDPAVNLLLASRYASIANYWKYYIGQTEQLKKLNVLSEKKTNERDFIKWSKQNNMGYENLMDDFSQIYADYRPYAKHTTYISEGIYASNLARLAASTKGLYDLISDKKSKKEDIDKAVTAFKRVKDALMKEYVANMDKEIFAKSAELFYSDISKSQHPDVYKNTIFKIFGSENWTKTFNDYTEYVYLNTLFLNEVKLEAFLRNPTAAALEADPAFQFAYSFLTNYEENYAEKNKYFNEKRSEYAQTYVKGIMQKNKGSLMYPDANSTMRLTYGTVGGYNPQDAVTYKFYTNLNGLLDKYKPGDYEFDLPNDFLDLAKTKNFGRYANSNGELVVNFITNNDITGGNSGSPMINAEGHLTGLAFDGNWEAMSGDIAFDKKFKRTIAVDIRFVLWLMDKYGGATNLINEMTIVE
mgnify:CR=1 FL=1